MWFCSQAMTTSIHLFYLLIVFAEDFLNAMCDQPISAAVVRYTIYGVVKVSQELTAVSKEILYWCGHHCCWYWYFNFFHQYSALLTAGVSF